MTTEERLAMRSIYFHSRHGDETHWPEQSRPQPLAAAAEILSADQRSGAESRRRRALAKLLSTERRGDIQKERDLAAAIELLGGSSATVERVRAAALETVRSADDPDLLRPMPLTLAAVESSLGPCEEACERTPPQTSVDFDRQTLLIVGKSKLRVRRPIDELRRVIDPQNWDVVADEYFRQAYIAACDDSGNCGIDADFNAMPASSPPQPGSSWSEVFFENYEIDIGPFNVVTFKVLLDIETDAAPEEHHVRYSLRKVLFGKVGPLTLEGGGLDMDNGSAQLLALADGWVEVSATKFFRLDGWTGPFGVDLDHLLNWWTSVTIETTLDSVYEAVCMDV